MKVFLGYFKGHYHEVVLAPLFKMLEATFELIVPFIVAGIVDKGIKNSDVSYVFRQGAIMIALGIIGCFCAIIAQYFSAKAAMAFGTSIRSKLFKHIFTLSYKEIDEVGTDTLITRMIQDINQIQTGVNLTLRLFLRSPFLVIGSLVMTYLIDKKMALVFLVTIISIMLTLYLIMKYTVPTYKKVQKSLDVIGRITKENFTGARVIRAFNKTESELCDFNLANKTNIKIQKIAAALSSLLNPLTLVLVNIGIIGVLYVGALGVNKGILKQGDVIALLNYMTQLLVALLVLANLIVAMTKAMACYIRVNDVLNMNTDMLDGNMEYKNTEKCGIELQNVSFSYGGDGENVLKNLSFSIESGEIFGIIGGTGSGKTTLISLFERLYDPTEGNVLIDGINAKEYIVDELRKKFALVPQKAVLFKGSILENLQMRETNLSENEIIKALEISNSKEFVMKKPRQLNYEISQGGGNLSGGQKQRLTIARALVGKSEYLILDDSTRALDFKTEKELKHNILENKENKTVIIVSQRVNAINIADRILVLKDGEIAGLGKHEDLVENCSEYREICISQGYIKGDEVND